MSKFGPELSQATLMRASFYTVHKAT